MTRALRETAAARFAWRTGRRFSRREAGSRGVTFPVIAALLFAIALTGCRPPSGKDTVPPAPAHSLAQVLATHTPELMAIPGVVGTAESRFEDGRPCVLVLVSRLTPELRSRLPKQLDGWPVRVEETGEIRAMPDSAR